VSTKPKLISGIVFAAALAVTLAIAWNIYRPGVDSAFVFDDFANLSVLGNQGPIHNREAFWRYITAGAADPIGRPLAMLSFLVDAQDWPADPAPFKRTNILLHLLNGALLCMLLLQLGRAAGKSERHAALAALLGGALWLMHPLWTSTVLYVVQREAMLPATFILLGLSGYLCGRALAEKRPIRGSMVIIASVVVGTALAMLCKANGILLPTFVLVLETVFLRNVLIQGGASSAVSRCLRLVAWPPTCAIFAYVIYTGVAGFLNGVPVLRPWTLGQRLLTEPRVLVEYLKLLAIPQMYSTGLFNDGYPLSTNTSHPWTTLPALGLVLALIVGAFALRKRHPYFALAMIFFFAGHLIESTTIPLEIYFEHRNYVPALLLFWPFALWLTGRGPSLRLLKPYIALAALTLVAAETYYSASLWGRPKDQAIIWAIKNPDSPRAQAYAATVEASAGDYATAETRLRHGLARDPNEIQLVANLLGIRCKRGGVATNDLATAEAALRNSNNGGPLMMIDWLVDAIDTLKEHRCVGLDATSVRSLIEALQHNEQARSSLKLQQGLSDVQGQLALTEGNASVALAHFNDALALRPAPDMALHHAALLGSHNAPAAGLEHLDYFLRITAVAPTQPLRFNMQGLHEWVLRRQGYWENEIAHLRQTLEQDIARSSAKGGTNARAGS
jgi:hypothetical protein